MNLVNRLVVQELTQEFQGSEGLLVVSYGGLNAKDNEGLRDKLAVPISVDTYKGAIAEKAFDLGVEIINDPSALTFDPELAKKVSQGGAGLILNHMRGTPETMQEDPRYTDVVAEVAAFLAERALAALAAGVAREAIVVDPGIGFGKTVAHNARLLAA